MKDSVPEATRSEYLDGDVTPKVRVTLRRTRLDFGVELYYKNDSTIPGVIIDVPPPVSKPTAAFHFTNADGSPPGGIVPLTVTVIDGSLGQIDEWLWEFGDGETSTSSTPGTHEYIAVGTYTVSLTVTNAQGSDKFARYNYVAVEEEGTPLEANFRFTDPDGRDPPYGAKPLTVDITNLSTGSPTSCKWTFGDDSISTNCSVATHTYVDKGQYTVLLQVWDAVGNTDELTKPLYVTVDDDPPPPTGEQLYVSKLGSNSTGDGTILSPWKTITYGIDRMSPGTTLNIRAGRYHEIVNLSNLKGTASNWYTFKSYDGASDPSNKDKAAIIDGEYSIPTGDYVCQDPKTGLGFVYAPLVKMNNCEYVKLDSIHVTRSRGRGIRPTVDSGDTGKHITFLNCHVYSCRASIMKPTFYDNVTIQGGEYYDSMNYCKYRRAARQTPCLNWAGAMTITCGSNHLVKDIVLHTSYGEGIHPFNWTNGVVEDNVVFNCMNGMLPITCCNGTVIQRNFIYSTRQHVFAQASMCNLTMEAGDKNPYRKGPSFDCRYINNIAVDGYINNRFMDRLANPDNENDPRWGFYRNSIVSHNTFVQHASVAPPRGTETDALIRWLKMTHTNDVKTIDICNNVHWCQGPGADVIEVSRNPQPKYRSNCWYPKPTETMAQGVGDIYDQDPGLVNVDANLTADGSLGYDILRAQADNYMLKDTSPVLGQGRNTQGDTFPVTHDFWNNARGTSPDMGAHEK